MEVLELKPLVIAGKEYWSHKCLDRGKKERRAIISIRRSKTKVEIHVLYRFTHWYRNSDDDKVLHNLFELKIKQFARYRWKSYRPFLSRGTGNAGLGDFKPGPHVCTFVSEIIGILTAYAHTVARIDLEGMFQLPSKDPRA